MTEPITRPTENNSAKIYQFPDRRRVRPSTPAEAVSTTTMRAPAVAAACGWYHDAAIAEAELTRKI